jgi:hypothetical protein
MPEPRTPRAWRSTAAIAAAVAAAASLCGALLLFGSYLLHKEQPVVGTPGPRAAFTSSEFSIAARQRACMSAITIPSQARVAQLELRQAASARGGPVLDLLLSGPDYEARETLPSEQAEGPVQVPIRAPRRTLIGSVCLINRGHATAVLVGSAESRSRSRSTLTIAGRRTAGNIALTFLGARRRSRLARLGEAFEHASHLTDDLLPAWLIWVLAVATLLAVPIATVAVVRRALLEDEHGSR